MLPNWPPETVPWGFGRRCTTSGRPRPKVMPKRHSIYSLKSMRPSIPRRHCAYKKDREELVASLNFPAQHWQIIRTSNPIESAFATIRHPTKRSKGCLSRHGMLNMLFQLGHCAEQNWRTLRGFDCLCKSHHRRHVQRRN